MTPQLAPDFKAELRAKANESLQRHLTQLEQDAQKVPIEPPSQDMLDSFGKHLKKSNRILALFGAGLSAASGIPTYRSPNGFWRTYSDQQLATSKAFKEDPCFVWQFYNYKRAQALATEPNEAHRALAKLARVKPGFCAVNQNVDGLCERAGHPLDQIVGFHGSLFRVQCVDDNCGYEAEDFNNPIIPALQLSVDTNYSDARAPLVDISIDDLPKCPKCKVNLLRPAVLWFGEAVPDDRTEKVEKWLNEDLDNFTTEATSPGAKTVDLMLVVGTSAVVYPAAAYIQKARERGARVAFFNMEVKDAGIARPDPKDWSFVGDASKLLPQALEAAFLNTC